MKVCPYLRKCRDAAAVVVFIWRPVPRSSGAGSYRVRSVMWITANTALPMGNAACILRRQEVMVMLRQFNGEMDVAAGKAGRGMEVYA